MRNEQKTLDDLTKSYVINVEAFTKLKYMIQDFMEDTASIKMRSDIRMMCESRIEQINDLITIIEKTKSKINPKYDKSENEPFSDYGREIQEEFNRFRAVDWLPMLEEHNGDVLAANHEFIKWHRSQLKDDGKLKD